MPIDVGSRVGQYVVTGLLGEGGMGRVYEATDTTLKRQVALKVLPDVFAADPERVARFRSEAQVLAKLNHPGIAAIYGIETLDGTQALVLELVDGPTLADRIARHPMPVDDALSIAKQIAAALEAAHEAGVVHRDLKPANVKVRPDGAVKILDFGLAKALAPFTTTDPTQSPTAVFSDSRLGEIVGTAAYMSPEQARGRPVDKRTDIWAFGAVLFEMLTGRPLFDEATISETLAAVIEREPDLGAIPPAAGAAAGRLLRRCLHKDPQQRLRDIGEARIMLEGTVKSREEGPHHFHPEASAVRQWPTDIALALVGVAIGVFGMWALPSSSEIRRPETRRFVVPISDGDQVDVSVMPSVALSRDGSILAYAGRRDGTQELFLRRMHELEVEAVPGSDGATGPTFSPDGAWLGFFADGQLKKVATAGGSPIPICDVEIPRGIFWSPDGFIYFAESVGEGLFRVPQNGGSPEPATRVLTDTGERTHWWPTGTPDGRVLLLTAWTGGSYDDARIVAVSMATGERRTVIDGGTNPLFLSSGHLAFIRNGTLYAVPFNPDRLEIDGVPRPVLDDVSENESGAAHIAVSDTGVLAYLPGRPNVDRRLVWVDREGRIEQISDERHPYLHARVAPDGHRLITSFLGENVDLWLYDTARGTSRRLTFDEGLDTRPIWTPDGEQITYIHVEGDQYSIRSMASSGAGDGQLVMTHDTLAIPVSWSPDGTTLAVNTQDVATGWDVFLMSQDNPASLVPYLHTPFDERHPTFSPDGRWIAYTSNETGRDEVYVQSYPEGTLKLLVSVGGGTQPVWAPDSGTLFYRSGGLFLSVSVASGDSLDVSEPVVLFAGAFDEGRTEIDYTANYDVTPDGDRFVMIQSSEANVEPQSLVLVLDWFEELGRVVPTL